jgi:Putative peptidoglycan binding domain
VTWINIDEADQSEPVLKIGSIGLPVRRAQKRMSLVGFEVGGVDGRYGTQTEAAVKQLRSKPASTWMGSLVPRPVSHRRAGERRPRKLNLELSSGL